MNSHFLTHPERRFKMFQRKKQFLLYALLIGLFIFPTGASADNEIQFDILFGSFTPIFMSGHEGDINWIEGFTGTGDIYLGDTMMGTLTATYTAINPPASFTERYEYAKMKIVHTITGMGTFEVNGMALSMGSSTATTDYKSTLSWSGSISNGTGSLSGLVGHAVGTAQVSLATFTGTATEMLLYRIGY